MGLILPGGPQHNQHESNRSATPSTVTPGTAVSHHNVAHTKNPTFTQLIASTAFDTQLITIVLNSNNVANGNSSTLLDIAIGAASSETVIIPDLMAGFIPAPGDTGSLPHYVFPLYIPAGSRLSARTQSVRTTGSVGVTVQLYGGPRDPDRWWCGQTVTAYGPNAANSAGVKFTPGASGAEGTAVVVGTTTAAHECFVFGVQGHPDDVSWATQAYHFDMGIDSASPEWLQTDRFYAIGSSNESVGFSGHPWLPIYCHLPSGTELLVRGESGGGTPDALSAAFYGIS